MTRVFLLILLELPPSRQSPSHIKLLETFSDASCSKRSYDLPTEMCLTIEDLILAFRAKQHSELCSIVEELYGFLSLTKEQHLILQKLEKKFQK